MAKLIKPNRTNREESVQALWKRLGLEGIAAKGVDRREEAIAQYVGTGVYAGLGGIAYRLAYDYMRVWIVNRWKRGGSEAPDAQRAFAYMYWGSELLFARNRSNDWRMPAGEPFLHDLLAWQGITAACGQTWFTEWLAPYMHHLFANGNVDENDGPFHVDQPALRFTTALQRSLLTGRWPATDELQGMGDYASLFANASHNESFSAALVDYCDYRVSECFGYHGIDATKRRRPSVTESVLDRGGFEQILPVELLTLSYAYQKAHGRPLWLQAPHPLLQTPLMTAPWPELMPLYEDDTLRMMQAFGAKHAGAHWRLREPMPMG